MAPLRATNNKRTEAVRRISRKAKSDPATQRVSKIVCFPNAQIVQHSLYVRGTMSDVVCGGIVRLVALAMASCIEKDQLMVFLQGVHVSKINPTCTASERSVMENECGASADCLIMNANTLIVGDWHCPYPGAKLPRLA